MGVTEETGKVMTAAVDAMKAAPLAIALLLVNCGFLAFSGYVLGEVASNANDRNRSQLELITTLVKEMRDCHRSQT